MPWEELPQVKKGKLHIGCFSCSTASYELDLNRRLTVGFGSVVVTKDGAEIYTESDWRRRHNITGDNDYYESYPQAYYIEGMAANDPDHDWRITFYGALHGETYQRHKDGKWVCVESNKGFA